MNNPLAQQAQYYLNESSRLSEELNTEIEYSAVLEAVLEELVGTEDFLKIMEVYSNPGSIDLTASGGIRSDKPGRNNRANVTKRIGQLGKIVMSRHGSAINDLSRHEAQTPIIGGEVDDQIARIARDRQGVKDAALAFKTHGGQVTGSGHLIPSASNDNTAGIRMKDAKELGVPVHIDPRGTRLLGLLPRQPTFVDLATANAARLQRQGVRTQVALDREAFSGQTELDGSFMTKGQLAKSINDKKSAARRMAAGQDAATRSGMVTMKDHYDLVQGIMNLLTSNEKKNDIAVNELSNATHTSYREKGTRNLAQRGLKAAVDGMHLGHAATLSQPDSISSEEMEGLATDGAENAIIIRKRQDGLLRSGRLKPLGGQPLDMSKPKKQGPIGKIRGAVEAQRKLLGNIKPINSSYEPDLVQGIMNLLANK